MPKIIKTRANSMSGLLKFQLEIFQKYTFISKQLFDPNCFSKTLING